MRLHLWVGFALLAWGCDEPIQTGPRPPSANPAAPDAGAVDGTAVSSAVTVEIREDLFGESEASRDPFRSFSSMWKTQPTANSQRAVIMPTTSIDEMRLIAIVTGVAQPRAMLVDPGGVGHVVRRGDYIGRSEVVQMGGSDAMPVALNWRVDRIRPNDIGLTREDPTAPNRPPLSRTLVLRDDTDIQVPIPGVTPTVPPAPTPTPTP